MTNFLEGLWGELRARRLWPVAALLLVGVVAAPVLLSKKSEEPTPSAAPTASRSSTQQPDALARVKLDDKGDSGSSLSSFDAGDPFAPPANVLEQAKNAEQGTPIGSAPTETAPAGGSTPGGSAPGGSSPGGGPTGGGETGGGETGGGGTKTTNYTYVLDVTFTANGRTRKIHGMQKLDILPNEASPLLIFMGVTDNAGNAVFLVDSTLQAAGEGRCKPSGSDCAFVYIGPGAEEDFTTDSGDSYTLVVDEIRKVKVGAEGSAAKHKGKTASAAVGKATPSRRFAMPIIADLVSVSSGENSHSNSDGDRR